MTDPHDDLEPLLREPLRTSSPDREAIFTASLAGLPRRRRWPTWLRTATVFAVGLGVGWWLRPPVMVTQTITERIEVSVPAPAAPAPPEPLQFRSPMEVADKLESAAEQTDDRSEAARLYRQAGDVYFHANQVLAAVRCYKLHLAQAGDQGRTGSKTDTWLLTSLRRDRFQEANDDQAGS